MPFLHKINIWFRNLGLRKKIIVLISVMIFFLVLNSAISYYLGYLEVPPQIHLEMFSIVLVVTILALVLAIYIGLLVSSTIVNPVKILANKMRLVSEGNIDIEPQKVKYSDEIGDLNISFNKMTDRLRCLINNEAATSERERFLRNIILASITTLQTNKVLGTVVIETGKRFNAAKCYFIRYDDLNKKFLPIRDYEIYLSSLDNKDLTGKTIELEEFEPFLHILLQQRQELVISDVLKMDLPDKTRKFFEYYNIKSFIAAPVLFQERPIGILMADFDNAGKDLQQEEIQLFTSIADQSAIVVHQTELFQEARTARDRANTLRSIVTDIRNSLDINETLNTISKEIADLMNVNIVYLAEFPDRRTYKNWKLRVAIGLSIDTVTINREGLEYWCEKALYAMNNFTVSDIDKADIPDYFKHNCRLFNIKSIIGIPIKKGEEIWGSLSVADSQQRNWTDEEINLLQTIADQIYIAINQSELFTSTRKLADREASLRRVTEAIKGSLDLNEILRIVCTETVNLFNVDRSYIIEFPNIQDYSLWKIREDYRINENIPSLKNIDLPDKQVNEYLTQNYYLEGKNFIVNDLLKNDYPDFLKTLKTVGIRSILGIPIKSGNIVWGILSIAMVNISREWTDEEISLLENITGRVSIAIRQAELYSKTEENVRKERFLRTINNEILTNNTFEEAVNNICKEIGTLFDVDRVAIRIFDPVYRNFSEVKCEHRKNESILSSIGRGIYPEELNEYLIREIGEKKQIIQINDINNPQYPEILRTIFKSLNVKSIIIAPVIYKDTFFALLYLTNTVKQRNWKEKDIEIIQPLTQQIALGINMFNVMNKLAKSLDTEKVIKDIILTSREMTDKKQIFDYLLKKLADMFNVKRTLHVHYDEYNNLTVENEYIKNNGHELKALIGQPVLKPEHTAELTPKSFKNTIVINNVNTEIHDNKLKEYLINNDIQALVICSKSYKYPEQSEESVTATTILCSDHPRIWSANEVDSFRLIIDASSLVSFEILQRKESEETRRTFLATLTHDLRSPLNAEQKAIEAILSGRLGTSLNNFSEYLEDIYKTNEELLRMVNNILSVYHYEEGKFELKLEEVNIAELVETSVSVMRPLANAQNMKINMDIESKLPLVRADRDEILRVINNLVNNAIKHNARGTTINISVKVTDEKIQVAVQDNGKGIAEEEKKKIFQRYPTAKRKIGTGLGLYLSKQIIDAHDGNIWFETELGKGTTFYFTLPIIDA